MRPAIKIKYTLIGKGIYRFGDGHGTTGIVTRGHGGLRSQGTYWSAKIERDGLVIGGGVSAARYVAVEEALRRASNPREVI